MDKTVSGRDHSWYLLNEDEFEGPIPWSDLTARVQTIPKESSCFVWHPDLAEWKESSAFPELIQGVLEPVAKKLEADSASTASAPFVAGPILPEAHLPRFDFAISPIAAAPIPAKPAFSPRALITLGIICGLLLLVGAQYWQRIHYPLPSLPDLTVADFARLEAAARTPLREAGPRAEIALSQIDTAHPVFRVAANLADGEELELILTGVPETLVGSFQFARKIKLGLRDGLAQTAPLRLGGHDLAPGEYHLEVQNRGSTLSERNLFLGGPRDGKYAAALRAYHLRMHAEAAAAVTEITEMVRTMQAQLNQIAMRERAGKADPQWSRFAAQIHATLNAWSVKNSPETSYHAAIYERLPELWSKIEGLHAGGLAKDEGLRALSAARLQLDELDAKLARLASTSVPENRLPER